MKKNTTVMFKSPSHKIMESNKKNMDLRWNKENMLQRIVSNQKNNNYCLASQENLPTVMTPSVLKLNRSYID
jgi:hypothetical protein